MADPNGYTALAERGPKAAIEIVERFKGPIHLDPDLHQAEDIAVKTSRVMSGRTDYWSLALSTGHLSFRLT